LGGSAVLLNGAHAQGIAIGTPDAFTFNGLATNDLRSLSRPVDEPAAASRVRRSLADAIDAVTRFAEITSTDDGSADPTPQREGGASIADGLALAATILIEDPDSRIVVVSAGGFDTHANQAATQAALLGDLATGLAAFAQRVDSAGLPVLTITTSEFGRRVHENASAGTDHGAGNVSFAMGPGVRGGVVGEVDLGNLLDGDVRPTVDPRALYTDALDWLGSDPTVVLGKRYDGLALLR
jgi:uncharacterized protein (DUF1501 family)